MSWEKKNMRGLWGKEYQRTMLEIRLGGVFEGE